MSNYTSLDAYKAEGLNKCAGDLPHHHAGRVFWKRARSGRGTIYLYADAKEVGSGSESLNAFGWVPEHIAQTIYTRGIDQGYANWFNTERKVVFTDDTKSLYQLPNETTNFLEQRKRHWVTGESLPIPVNQDKEAQVANVDYSPRKLGYQLGESNKKAFFSAAYLEAGSLATKQLVKIASKALPIMARGYADTVFGKLILANIAQMAVQYSRPDNQELVKLTDAMVATAYLDAIRTVDLDSIIDQMLEGSAIKNALKRAQKEDKDASST